MADIIWNLLSSNRAWAAQVVAEDPHFFERSAKGQSPKILWLGCSDSRVPESVITASKPGHIFSHRNIANQVHLDDDNAISVITFAVAELGVEHILVVGHTECGGAKACLEAAAGGELPPGPLGRWLTPLTDLTRTLDLEGLLYPEALAKVIRASVAAQVENVVETEPVKNAWKKRNLWVHGLVYELETGILKDLCITKGPRA